MSGSANHQLAAVMQGAGVSNKGLAALVRTAAAHRRLNITPDHVSVRRWLEGVMPRPSTAECIADALSARVGRRLSTADLGFAAIGQASSLTLGPARFIDSLDESIVFLERLSLAHLEGDPRINELTWTPGISPAVITGLLFSSSTDLELGPLSTEPRPADRIHAMLRRLADLDFEFGGGHSRDLILFFWKSEILPLLKKRLPETARKEVLSAAADAAELLGWSAYDAGQHGAAQHYFSYGLALAKEAQDRLMGAQILSNMSHQANYLGRFTEAVQLARASQMSVAGMKSGTVQSMLYAMEARALASLGEAQECQRTLNKAERAFEGRSISDDPDWINYFDEFELAGEAAHCFRDLRHASKTQDFAGQAIDSAATPPRTQAFIAMVSAAGALRGGNLDEALHQATTAFHLADSLRSSRYLRYVADFENALNEQFSQHASVLKYLELLRVSRESEGAPL